MMNNIYFQLQTMQILNKTSTFYNNSVFCQINKLLIFSLTIFSIIYNNGHILNEM